MPAADAKAKVNANAPAPAAKAAKIAGAPKPLEYVRIEDVAARHGLAVSWLQPQKRVLLRNEKDQVEIEAGSREMRVNGLRVFLGDPSRWAEGGLRITRIDAEKFLAGILSPSETGAPRVTTIAIDPGHGGSDTGTQNAALGLREKIFTLDVSVRLKAALEKRGYRVAMTRQTDVDVGLGARAIIANQAQADLFLSIHFNAVDKDKRTKGAEVFTFAPQFQRSADAWGAGKDDTEALPAPVNRFDSASVACAHAIHGALVKELKVEDRGQKIAHWGVLRPLNCPGVLIEPGFLSNDDEGRKIGTPEYRQRIAETIARGVDAYVQAVASKN